MCFAAPMCRCCLSLVLVVLRFLDAIEHSDTIGRLVHTEVRGIRLCGFWALFGWSGHFKCA